MNELSEGLTYEEWGVDAPHDVEDYVVVIGVPRLSAGGFGGEQLIPVYIGSSNHDAMLYAWKLGNNLYGISNAVIHENVVRRKNPARLERGCCNIMPLKLFKENAMLAKMWHSPVYAFMGLGK